MIKGIIFDLDGTLVRLPIQYNEIFKKLQILFDTNDEFKPLIPTIIKKSKNEKYTSVSVKIIAKDPDLIINNYKKVANKIENVILL